MVFTDNRCQMCGAPISDKKLRTFAERKREKARLGKDMKGPYCSKVCSDKSRRKDPAASQSMKRFAVRSM